jgi:hypothetical protein
MPTPELPLVLVTHPCKRLDAYFGDAARACTAVIAYRQTPADVRARLTGQGAEVVTMASNEQDPFFNRERSRWAQVVAAPNIKLD